MAEQKRSSYQATIKAVNDALVNSDPRTWWPTVQCSLTSSGRLTTVHIINGECVDASLSHCEQDTGHFCAFSDALLRLILDDHLACALFAVPYDDCVQDQGVVMHKEDVVVAAVYGTTKDAQLKLVPAWHGKSVYPMRAFSDHSYRHVFAEKPDWLLMACLRQEERDALSAIGSIYSEQEIEQATPVVGPLIRKL